MVKRMSKLIAVWGSPESGKTTFAVKLASAIYGQYKSTVLAVLADDVTPTLPVLFPTRKSEDLYSIGCPLSRAEITPGDVVAGIVTLKDKQNFGFLGYKDGENRYTYPEPGEAKCREFLRVVQTLADVVIVDCTSQMNALSKAAVQDADTMIRLVSPDLKSIAFCASQLPLYADPAYHSDQHIIGLNTNRNDVYLPVEDAKQHFGEVSFVLPFSQDIRLQAVNGTLTDRTKDRVYNEKLKAIAGKVMG